MSKSLSAVAVAEPMTPDETANFHMRMLGKPFGAWHKPKRVSEAQAKWGMGRTFNVGSNDKKRARRRTNEFRVSCCGRKRKNCVCGN